MEYRIRIHPGKEKAFEQFIRALQTLGVVEEAEKAPGGKSQKNQREQKDSSSEELASQYRDLVD